MVYSIERVPGKEIAALGYVSGGAVMSKHFGRDIAASLKNIVGGELRGYTEMLQEARTLAVSRVEAEAVNLGADAVVGLHFTMTSWPDGATGLMAYGTAVKVLG